MKIAIRKRGVEVSAALRAHVERRVGLALGRFGDLIAQVTVRFSSAGELVCCQIDVAMLPRTIRTEDTNADIFAAIDHAADRASRSIDRALERENELE